MGFTVAGGAVVGAFVVGGAVVGALVVGGAVVKAFVVVAVGGKVSAGQFFASVTAPK